MVKYIILILVTGLFYIHSVEAKIACYFGYEMIGHACVKIYIPPNGHLDPFTHKAECNPGYVKSDRSCLKINLPNNASLNSQKDGWVCNDGYVKDGEVCKDKNLDAIKEKMILESISRYSGNCPCPYNYASNGSKCGKRSAYSRAGGYSPLCYKSDISDQDAEKILLLYNF